MVKVDTAYASGEYIDPGQHPVSGLRPDTFLWAAMVLLFSITSAKAWLGVSRDYLEYLQYYRTISPFLSVQDTRFEPGFHFIAWTSVNIFHLPFWAFIFVIVTLAIAIKAYLFKRYLTYPITAMIVYLATFYPNQEYTQIRVAAAISVGMLALHLFMAKRYAWFLIAVVTSALFHYSIVVLIGAFFASYFLRRNALSVVAVAVLAVIIAGALFSTGGLNSVIINWFSRLNPLVGSYVDNIAAIDAASIWSVNNLIVIAMFAAAGLAGWLSKSRYQKTFTIMFGLSVIFIILLSQSPIIAVRAKEMLLVSVVFAAFRDPLGQRDIIPVFFVCSNAALLLFLAIREGVILSIT